MPPVVYPESAAIVFAADRRVFVTPEVANPRVGEDCLLRALRLHVRPDEAHLLRVGMPFSNAFAEANPGAREVDATEFASLLDAGAIAFMTLADRVLIVHDNYRHPRVSTHARWLGAAVFMEHSAPHTLVETLNMKHPAGTEEAHVIRGFDGWEYPIHSEDLAAIESIAQRQLDTLPEASPRRACLLELIDTLSPRLEPATQPESQVIRGPWGR